MTCVGVILAKNEADRYLANAIRSLDLLCDRVLVLDDGSTEDTATLAESMGAEVRRREGPAMWGQEAPARAELWAWGAEVAGDGWLYVLDADHVTEAPVGAWRGMLASTEANAWGIRLYDCWDSPQRHRVDGYWAGHELARPWLFRPSACPEPVWPTRGLHCGHAPANFPYRLGVAPSSVWIRHLGWMNATDREAKVARYMSAANQLRPDEMAHLQSVTDDNHPCPNP